MTTNGYKQEKDTAAPEGKETITRLASQSDSRKLQIRAIAHKICDRYDGMMRRLSEN